MEKEMEKSDGNSIRNDEENQKEQVEGGGPDSGVGIGNSDMDVEQDVLAGIDEQPQEVADVEDVERTPVPQVGRGTPPQTSEKVDIPVFTSIETGKQFVLPDARARSRRDQVSGVTASKAAQMRAECKRVQAVTYEVRADTVEGLQALRKRLR